MEAMTARKERKILKEKKGREDNGPGKLGVFVMMTEDRIGY